MRSFLLILVLAMLGGCSGDDGGSMTPDAGGGDQASQIFAIVQDQVIAAQGWSDEVVRIYGMETPLQPGQTVGPAFDTEGNEVTPTMITEPTWFFWADTSPSKFFSHSTVFIYLDEDGSNLRVERQKWFPLIDDFVFMPDVPTWGPADIGAADMGSATAAYRTMQGEPCGEAHAVVIQGVDDDRASASANEAIISLMGRGYTIHRVTPLEEPDPERLFNLLKTTLAALTTGEQMSQVDIFYLGHATPKGEWVFGPGEIIDISGKTRKVLYDPTPGSTLLDLLGDVKTARVNVIVDSCHAENFAKGELGIEASLADSMASDTFFQVVAGTVAAEEGAVTEDGALFTEHLLNLLEMQPGGEPFEYDSAMLGPLSGPGVDDEGNAITVRQTPAPLFFSSPTAPLLFVDKDYDECQVVAHLPYNEFAERRVTIRGAGFGEAEGTVQLTPWEFVSSGRDPMPKAPVAVPVFSWSDQAIVIQVPMRSMGFPGDPENVPTYTSFVWPDNTPELRYMVGNYFVQVTTNTGAKSADYQGWFASGTPAAQEHFYAPQLVHVDVQIREETWTPDYTGLPVGIEFHEMWLQMVASSPGIGSATVAVSDLRAGSDPVPPAPWGNDVSLYSDRRGSEPHTTGFTAQSRHMGRWDYDLPAAERDLLTAMDTRLPMVNFWGFRQQFEPLSPGPTDFLTDGGSWDFLLIYD